MSEPTEHTQDDPFKSGRILSGGVYVRDVNFTFSIWGYRTISPEEAKAQYDFWRINHHRGALPKDTRIDVLWTE